VRSQPHFSDLSREAIVPQLRGRFGRPYRYVATCPSTQRLLAAEDPEGAVAVADEQTEGRGRLGRRWEAPAGTSLLLSLLLRPNVPTEELPTLSPVARDAIADAIAAVSGAETRVKLPNDVLIAGRKAAGVLAEAQNGRVVLGIGVNVNQQADELPPKTQLPATSLRLEVGRPVDRATLLVELLERVEQAYDGWGASYG